MKQYQFITIGDPSQLTHPENKRRVASHVGIHHRNRSQPSKRNGSWVYSGIVQYPTSRTHRRVQGQTMSQIPHDHYGIRVDPFKSYPGNSPRAVTEAIDHYFDFLAPTHIIRVDEIGAAPSPSLVRRYFRYMMEKPLLFEATMAIAQLSATANFLVDRDESFGNISGLLTYNDAFYHYGQAIVLLRRSIQSSVPLTEDATLFAIACLIGFDFLLDNTTALETHLRGLWQIAKLRSEHDPSEWSEILGPLLNGIEIFSHYIFRYTIREKTPSSNVTTFSIASNGTPQLETNTIAVSLDLETISTNTASLNTTAQTMSSTTVARLIGCLPQGFQVLARQPFHRLSNSLIVLLNCIATTDTLLNHNLPSTYWTRGGRALCKTHSNTSNLQLLEFTVWLLNVSSLLPVERMICFGVLMTLMESSRIERLSRAWQRQCELMSSDMLHMLGSAEWEQMNWNERHCVAWAAMDIAGSYVPPRAQKLSLRSTLGQTNVRLQLAIKIRQLYGHGYDGLGIDWEHMEAILKGYFWTDRCKASWKTVWELSERNLSIREQMQST